MGKAGLNKNSKQLFEDIKPLVITHMGKKASVENKPEAAFKILEYYLKV